MHVLQPCDVGVFGPLVSSWKAQVNEAARNYMPITKHNLLEQYSAALLNSAWRSGFKTAKRPQKDQTRTGKDQDHQSGLLVFGISRPQKDRFK
jgi:hypothetical protein